jgi:DNA-binding NtrC family response regulator
VESEGSSCGGLVIMSAHLLIVEDDPEMLDLLRKVLEKEGYRVSLAADSHEATASLSKIPFDLVVTDMVMPDNGGLELLQAIRASQPALPVIIITAFGDWGTYSRALELGAAAFISKPLKMAELTTAIHTALAGAVPARLPKDRSPAAAGRGDCHAVHSPDSVPDRFL